MPLKYLICGATGGFGQHVLRHFVENSNVAPSEFAAASSKLSNEASFRDRGIAFRHIDYSDLTSLETGLRDVENLLFVSGSTKGRMEQHKRIIEVAKQVGVKHIWYTSLAWGGFENNTRSSVQVEHVETERLLRQSGITYTSIREGIYAEAFPIFLNWRPDSEKLVLPADGEVAFTSRAELGEATARLMLKGGYENQIVMFTAQETISARQIVENINNTTNRQVQLQIVSREDYIRQGHEENASEQFEMIAKVWDDILDGALSHTDRLLPEVLEREPTKPKDSIRLLLTENGNYTYP